MKPYDPLNLYGRMLQAKGATFVRDDNVLVASFEHTDREGFQTKLDLHIAVVARGEGAKVYGTVLGGPGADIGQCSPVPAISVFCNRLQMLSAISRVAAV